MCSSARRSSTHPSAPTPRTGRSTGRWSTTTASTGSIGSAAQSKVRAVPDPLTDHDQLASALRLVEHEAQVYLAGLDDALVRPPVMPGGAIPPLPAEGDGSVPALISLIEAARDGATRSSGPRFFHFVMGGSTPAA